MKHSHASKQGNTVMKMNKLFNNFSVVLFATGLSLSSLTMAGPGHDDGGHGHGNSQSSHKTLGSESDHMMTEKKMNKDIREVMGKGRINKIMKDKHMVNIKHEPIPEMKWPKMNMNFKTQEQVNLSDLSLGQEVTFTLLVDGDNNYVIKEIIAK